MLQGVEDLEKSHQFQATNAQTELKKEMNLLQKKILMDTVSIGIFGPRRDKTCLWGFRQSETQTILFSFRD